MATTHFTTPARAHKVKSATIGTLWFNQDVAAAIDAHIASYGQRPTVCVVHPLSPLASEREVQGLRIRRENLLLPKHIHLY